MERYPRTDAIGAAPENRADVMRALQFPAEAEQATNKRRENAWRRYQSRRVAQREQRRQRGLENARSSYMSAMYFNFLGRFAIGRAASVADKDPAVVSVRRRELMDRWRKFARESFNRPVPPM